MIYFKIFLRLMNYVHLIFYFSVSMPVESTLISIIIMYFIFFQVRVVNGPSHPWKGNVMETLFSQCSVVLRSCYPSSVSVDLPLSAYVCISVCPLGTS